MDILDDMGVSKLSANVFFFFKSELLLVSPFFKTSLKNKSLLVNDIITTNNLDFLFLN